MLHKTVTFTAVVYRDKT